MANDKQIYEEIQKLKQEITSARRLSASKISTELDEYIRECQRKEDQIRDEPEDFDQLDSIQAEIVQIVHKINNVKTNYKDESNRLQAVEDAVRRDYEQKVDKLIKNHKDDTRVLEKKVNSMNVDEAKKREEDRIIDMLKRVERTLQFSDCMN